RPRPGNEGAAALAKARGLPALVGPDAHRLGEVGLARVEFEGALPAGDEGLKRALREAPRRFHTGTGSIWDEWLSQAVKILRRPSLPLAYFLARGALRRIVKPRAYERP